MLRDPAAVLEDTLDGRIDAALARKDYRVVIDRRGRLDHDGTARLRGAAAAKPSRTTTRNHNRKRRVKS